MLGGPSCVFCLRTPTSQTGQIGLLSNQLENMGNYSAGGETTRLGRTPILPHL